MMTMMTTMTTMNTVTVLPRKGTLLGSTVPG